MKEIYRYKHFHMNGHGPTGDAILQSQLARNNKINLVTYISFHIKE